MAVLLGLFGSRLSRQRAMEGRRTTSLWANVGLGARTQRLATSHCVGPNTAFGCTTGLLDGRLGDWLGAELVASRFCSTHSIRYVALPDID